MSRHIKQIASHVATANTPEETKEGYHEDKNKSLVPNVGVETAGS
jgi:hypothetical protein